MICCLNPDLTGTMSKAEIEQSYKISRRIEGEERGLDYATMVFTSTQQEVGWCPCFVLVSQASNYSAAWATPP